MEPVAPPASDVTAVIPCRDGAGFLREAIASVRAQTLPVVEIIVVDDGSADDSAALARQLGARVIRHDASRGNGAARNTGIEATGTALVALLDVDDLWLPEHLATVVPLLARYPDAGAAFATMRVFGEGVPSDLPLHVPRVQEGEPQWLLDACFEHYIGQPSTCVLRRSAALAVGGFDETMPVGVDFEMWLRLAHRFPFVAAHRVTGLYRRHAAQISADALRQVEMCFRARHRMWRTLGDGGEAEQAARAGEITRTVWERALRNAWEGRQRQELRALVALAPLIPDGEPQRRRWRRRLAIPEPLLTLWQGTGERVRAPLRRLLRWLER